MNKTMRKVVCTLAIAVMILSSLSFGVSAASKERAYPQSVDELDGLRAGVTVGTVFDKVVEDNFPNSKIEFFNAFADMVGALQSDKVDYFVTDGPMSVNMLSESEDMQVFKESLYDMPMGFIFRKGDEKSKQLREQFNEFLAKHEADGTLEEIRTKWFDGAADLSQIEKPEFELTGENGNIDLATNQTCPPYAYIEGDELQGLDIELIKMFCYEYGYTFTYSASDFNGIIPAIASGKSDIGGAGIAITAERQENVDFSDSYGNIPAYAVALKENASGGIFGSLRKSFNNTFVREDRWKTILGGVKVTLTITLFAGIFGSIIGFLIYLLCRKGNKILNRFFDAFAWLLSGLPMVVILMILYYVLFAKSAITGVTVSIIAFAASLALSVYSMLKTSVKSIDRGQIEGSYSLGFTDRQTFFGIVLPQAMTQFLPNYKNQFAEMLKGTAIVGYIAVQDLTKVSDVIRSRTYEAFFPLIATALIYLALVWLFIVLFNRVQIKYEPKRRSDDKVLKRYGK